MTGGALAAYHPPAPGKSITVETKTLSARRIALVGGLMVALGPVGIVLYTPALPAMAESFGSTEAAAKLTMTAFFVGLAVAQLVAGPLSDAFGRRPVTLGFLGLYVVASLACAFAPTMEALIAARFVQGFGAAPGLAVSRAIVRDGFTGEAAARLYNLIGMMLAVAPTVSPGIGAVALTLFGWNAVFGVMVGYGLLLLALFFFLIPESNRAPDRRAVDPRRLLPAWRTVLGSAAFLRPSILMAIAVGGLHTASAIIPFLLIGAVGLGPFGFALAMLVQSGAYILSTVLVHRLLVRFPARPLMHAGVGAVALAACLALLTPLTGTVSVAGTMAPVAIWMLGIALVMPGATGAAMAPFPSIAGSASALLGFFQLTGGILGSAASAFFADPADAFGAVLPAMAGIALLALLIRDEPAAGEPAEAVAQSGPPAR